MRCLEIKQLDIEKLKMIHDFQLKSLIETVNFLLKLVTFYFALLAASVAYVFASIINTTIKEIILTGIFGASILFSIAIISLSYGVITGLTDLNKGMLIIGKVEYKKMNLTNYFKRGIRVSYIVVFSCLGIIFVLMVALGNILVKNLI